MPLGVIRRVDAHLREYFSLKPRSLNGLHDSMLSGSSGNDDIATDEGLFDQPEPLPHNKAALEKIIWQRSLQMHTEQQAWQVELPRQT